MKRRDLLAGLLPLAVAPLARAQQPSKIYRIALVHSLPPSQMNERSGVSYWQAMFQELRRLGYEEGRNLKVERYSEEGREEVFPQLAKQVVATQPDLIFVFGRSGSVVAEAAAGRVPIIGMMNDPQVARLSTSLARPSANVTGIVLDLRMVGEKRLQMMQEVRPGANHVAALTSQRYWHWQNSGGLAQQAYQQHGVRLTCLCVASPVQEAAYRQAFANLDHDRPDFINVFSDGDNFTYRELIISVVNEKRIPAIYPARQYVELGGLMSYAYDLDELCRHAARQMDSLLRGQPVSEVPWYMPMKWELAVNLKTAKALGLNIPPLVLAGADLVIE